MSGKLPFELYRPICENLDRSTLLSLTTVSRAFQTEAERLLHRVIVLGPTRSKAMESCDHLLRTPRFLDSVQSLIVPDDRSWTQPYGSSLITAFVTPLVSLLQKLPNLTNLGIFVVLPNAESQRIYAALAERCIFQLRIFRSHLGSTEFPSFLIDQHFIYELELKTHVGISHLALPSSAMPKLSILTLLGNFPVPADTINHFLAGRPVTHLACFALPALSPSYGGLALSTCPLKYLRVETTVFGDLEYLTDLCPSLEYIAYIDIDLIDVEWIYPCIFNCSGD
jgi:hypothetical protein